MDLASAKKCLGVTIQHADKEEVVHLCPSVPLHLPLVVLGSLFRAESGYFPARPQKKNPQKPVSQEHKKKGGDNDRRQENLQECRNHEHENKQRRIFHGTLGPKNVLAFSFQSRAGEAKLMENTKPSFPVRYQTLFYR
jgi:hypothetical protein